MESTLRPLLATVFIPSFKEELNLEVKLPPYYRRFVDDTLTVMPDTTSATDC